MKTVTYSCDTNGCKFIDTNKRTMITYVKYNKTADKKGREKYLKIEEHFCSEECLRKAKGFKELTVAK